MEASRAPESLPPGTTAVVVPMPTVLGSVGILFLVAVVGGLALHRQLWGRTDGGSTWNFLLLLAPAIIAHEGLHGLAMVLCGVPPRAVRFGFQLGRGLAYATTARPLSARHYRFVCALPLLVLGVLPLTVGLACGQHLAARLGAVMVALAGGDVAILLALRGVPPDSKVVDYPSEPGCYVLPADDEGREVR